MTTTLKAHPIWHDVIQTVAAIDPLAIVQHHLQACASQINGYWDENDQYYDTIHFTHPLIPTLSSSSLGITPNENGGSPWLNLRYSLCIADDTATIGELSLILNDNLEIIDENWQLNLQSPYLKHSPSA